MTSALPAMGGWLRGLCAAGSRTGLRKWKTNELREGCGLGGDKKPGIQLESRGRDLGLEGGTKELGLCLRPGGAARELLPRARSQEAGPESQARQCPRPRGQDQKSGRVRHLRPGRG